MRILLWAGGILSGLLTERLAQSRAGLHAWLSRSEIVLRGIPDEFEEAIVLGFVVDDDGRLVDLAADTDDIAADDGRGIAGRDGLRIGSRVALIGRNGRSSGGRRICAGSRSARLCPTRALLTNRAGLCRGARPGQGIRGSAYTACLGKPEVLLGRLQAANELSRSADVDEPPRTIFLVHGIFVGLAHEAE